MFEITGFEDNLDILIVAGEPVERGQERETEEEEGGAEDDGGGLEVVRRDEDDQPQDWEGDDAGEEEVDDGHLGGEAGVGGAGPGDGQVGEERRQDQQGVAGHDPAHSGPEHHHHHQAGHQEARDQGG